MGREEKAREKEGKGVREVEEYCTGVQGGRKAGEREGVKVAREEGEKQGRGRPQGTAPRPLPSAACHVSS